MNNASIGNNITYIYFNYLIYTDGLTHNFTDTAPLITGEGLFVITNAGANSNVYFSNISILNVAPVRVPAVV